MGRPFASHGEGYSREITAIERTIRKVLADPTHDNAWKAEIVDPLTSVLEKLNADRIERLRKPTG